MAGRTSDKIDDMCVDIVADKRQKQSFEENSHGEKKRNNDSSRNAQKSKAFLHRITINIGFIFARL